MKVFKFDFANMGYSGMDEDFCYAPIDDNLSEELSDYFEDEPTDEWIGKYIEKKSAQSWGYIEEAPIITVEEVDESILGTEIIRCDEFDLQYYKDTGIVREMYLRPFEESPTEFTYSSWFAADCDYGSIYSKDFGYQLCDHCGRDICVQNPSNGWHSQFNYLTEDEMVCEKCYQEILMESGVDIDEMLESERLQTAWFSDSELVEAGFEKHPQMDYVLIGMGRVSSRDPNEFWAELRAMREELKDKQVLFLTDSMSIGGMGGYVTMYTKNKQA